MKTMDPKYRQILGNSFLSLLVGLALALLPTTVFGLGVRIPNQDAEAIGRGNAFAATANNPSALYYNPAGITQLEGQHFQVGVLTYLGLVNEYRQPATGKKWETDYEVVPVPQVYYTFTRTNSAFSYGLGVYAPFGLGLEWPEDIPFRQLSIEGRLTYITFNPTVAWQIHRTLSIGAGPTINYSQGKLRQGIGVPAFFGGDPNDEFRFSGNNVGYGFHLGMLWKPCEKVALGANYRSPSSVNYRGHSSLAPYSPDVDTSVEIDFPQNVSGGISYRPTPKWNIEVDVDWTDWNSVDKLVFNGAINPFTGQTIEFNLNWRSSWFYHFGVTHYFQNGYFASLGYFFSEASTSEQYFKPYVPDTDLHVGSIGGGYKGQHWDWAASFQLITGPKRTVSGTETSFFGQSADGSYQFFVPAVSASIGYHF